MYPVWNSLGNGDGYKKIIFCNETRIGICLSRRLLFPLFLPFTVMFIQKYFP
jgi:hypothetical protein